MYYRGTRAASLLISKQNKLSNGQNTHTARIPRAKIVKFEEHSRRSSGNALLVAEFQMFTCKIPAFFVFAHSAAFKSAQSLPSHCDVWVEWSKFKFVFFHRNAQELTHTHTNIGNICSGNNNFLQCGRALNVSSHVMCGRQ